MAAERERRPKSASRPGWRRSANGARSQQAVRDGGEARTEPEVSKPSGMAAKRERRPKSASRPGWRRSANGARSQQAVRDGGEARTAPEVSKPSGMAAKRGRGALPSARSSGSTAAMRPERGLCAFAHALATRSSRLSRQLRGERIRASLVLALAATALLAAREIAKDA